MATVVTRGSVERIVLPEPLTEKRIAEHFMKTRPNGIAFLWLSSGFAVVSPAFSQPVGWFTDVKLSCGAVNTPIQDSNGAISADGLTLFFNRADDGLEDIHEATRLETDGCFDVVMKLQGEVNGRFEDIVTQTRTAPDGATTILFNSNRPGGFGQHDMYMATRPAGTQDFSNITNLGAAVNGPRDDRCAYITPDGLELFFYSDRPGGAGSWDVYRATRADVGVEFALPVNLGGAINTRHSERACTLSADGRTLFFFSDRAIPGDWRGYDMWIATRASREAPFENAMDLNDFSLGSVVNVSGRLEFPSSISPEWPGHGSKMYFTVIRQDNGNNWELYEATWIADPPLAVFTVSLKVVEDTMVELDASKSSPRGKNRIASYTWNFGDGTADEGRVAMHRYAAPGRYTVQLTVTDDRGSASSATQVIVVRPRLGDGSPWTALDIGEPESFDGGAIFEEDCLRIVGADGDLSGTADAFHFAHQTMTGSFALTARIAHWTTQSHRSQLGLMIRESAAGGARHGSVVLERRLIREDGFRHRFLRRELTDSPLGWTNHETYDSPDVWLRLERRGDLLSGMLSTDGKTWMAPDTLELSGLAEDVLAGVAASWVVRSGGPAPVANICDLAVVPLQEGPEVPFLRGDCDSDGDSCSGVNDALELLNWLFLGRAAPPCLAACDPDGNGKLELADAIYGLNFCFKGTTPPVAPFPECGAGTELDGALGCETSTCD